MEAVIVRTNLLNNRLVTAVSKWPRLIRFLAGYVALGLVSGVAVAAALLALPNLPIGTLLAETPYPVSAAFLYFGSFAFTFGSLAMGVAIMLLPWDDEGGK